MKKLAALLFLFILLIFPAPTLAVTSTFKTTADTTLSSKDTSLNDKTKIYIRVGYNKSTDESFVSLINFDLSSIPRGSTLNSAKLKLYLREFQGEISLPISIYRISQPWNIETVNYNNRPARYSGVSRLDYLNGAVGYKELDVSALVRYWISGRDPGYGFYIQPSTSTVPTYSYRFFNSKEEPYYPDRRPTLVIDYIPGPAPTPTPTPTPTPRPINLPKVHAIIPKGLLSPDSPTVTPTPTLLPRDENPTVIVSPEGAITPASLPSNATVTPEKAESPAISPQNTPLPANSTSTLTFFPLPQANLIGGAVAVLAGLVIGISLKLPPLAIAALAAAAGGLVAFQSAVLPLPPTPLPTPVPLQQTEQNKGRSSVEKTAQEAVQLLKNKNFDQFTSLIHPTKGVRFSPYTYVTVQKDKVFTQEQVKTLNQDSTKYTWGAYDGSGLPINLTFGEYYNKFIYDKDFAFSKRISINKPIGKGNSLNNILEVYPQATYVEYYVPGSGETSEMDWGSLRLVFEQVDNKWYLVGVVHDQWTI